MNAFEEIIRYLPPPLQEIILNPPNFSSPSSFIPLIRAILPYTQIIIVILAVYIVWSFISSLFGFFNRLARFGLKVSPIIGIIGLIMANSGQGNLNEVFDLIKQAIGSESGNGMNGQPRSAGIESLINLFGSNQNQNQANTRNLNSRSKKNTRSSSRKTKTGTGTGSGNGIGKNAEDIESILKSATGAHPDDEWSDVIQRYVKNSVMKAAGLDWLFGEKDERKSSTR